MQEIKVTGTVKSIGELNQVSDKFAKRELIIDTGDTYNPNLCIDFTNKNTPKLDYVKVGDNVTVKVNLSSRESKGKWYSSIQGWFIEGGTNTNVEKHNEVVAEVAKSISEDDGSLPF